MHDHHERDRDRPEEVERGLPPAGAGHVAGSGVSISTSDQPPGPSRHDDRPLQPPFAGGRCQTRPPAVRRPHRPETRSRPARWRVRCRSASRVRSRSRSASWLASVGGWTGGAWTAGPSGASRRARPPPRGTGRQAGRCSSRRSSNSNAAGASASTLATSRLPPPLEVAELGLARGKLAQRACQLFEPSR